MNDQAGFTRRAAILILAGIAVGGIILGAVLIAARVRRSTGEGLNAERRAELRERLDHDPRSIFIYDPVLSYRLKPDFRGIRHDSASDPHRTNSRGILGGKEINPDPTVRKVLFLGDSVVYGSRLPLEENFVSRLGEAADDSCQLLNAGVPGWSTHQELEFYRLYLADLPVDLVAIVFSLNDLLRFEWVWRDERSFQMSPELRGLGGLLQSRLTDLKLSRLRARFREDESLRPLTELNNTCLYAYLPAAWERYRKDIRPALEVLAVRRDIVLLAVPALPQLEALERGGDPEIVLYPQRRLQELSREAGIGYLDLLPAFQSAEGERNPELFLPGDTLHLSGEGHRRAAEWLQPRLLQPVTSDRN